MSVSGLLENKKRRIFIILNYFLNLQLNCKKCLTIIILQALHYIT